METFVSIPVQQVIIMIVQVAYPATSHVLLALINIAPAVRIGF